MRIFIGRSEHRGNLYWCDQKLDFKINIIKQENKALKYTIVGDSDIIIRQRDTGSELAILETDK
jgi:hypothetical protein